jgi:hypothetical protein
MCPIRPSSITSIGRRYRAALNGRQRLENPEGATLATSRDVDVKVRWLVVPLDLFLCDALPVLTLSAEDMMRDAEIVRNGDGISGIPLEGNCLRHSNGFVNRLSFDFCLSMEMDRRAVFSFVGFGNGGVGFILCPAYFLAQ